MIKLATKALRDALAATFTDLKGIYNNWPGPEIQERYPYMVVFTHRANVERLQYNELATLTDNSKLYGTGYWNVDLDVNYLSQEGSLEDQADVVDKMSDFFNINLTGGKMIESEASRDIEYDIQNYTAKANVRLVDIALDQRGPDLQPGDRRSVFTLNMFAPRLKIETPGIWTKVVLEPHISEKEQISS